MIFRKIYCRDLAITFKRKIHLGLGAVWQFDSRALLYCKALLCSICTLYLLRSLNGKRLMVYGTHVKDLLIYVLTDFV